MRMQWVAAGLVATMAAGTVQGQAAVEAAEESPATVWLDRATPLLAEIPTEEEAYTLADLAMGLMKAEAAAGRPERAAALFPKLHEASMKITLMDADTWSMAYLPAGHALSSRADEALRAAENLAFKPAVQLDAYQFLAEAADALGDDAAYNAFTAKMLALFPKVIADGVEEAKTDEFAYAGTYSGWFAAHAMRQRGDVKNLRRLATVGLADPMEQAGVLGVLAQSEWVAGQAEAARAALDKAIELADVAATRNLEDAKDDTYWPDANNAVPELVAAVWLLDGQAAALAKGEDWAVKFADEEVDWKCAAAVHAAEAQRRLGDEEGAAAALTFAVNALNLEPEGFTFETAWAVRGLVVQGRIEEARALAERPGSATFRAATALGMAEGLIGLQGAGAQ